MCTECPIPGLCPGAVGLKVSTPWLGGDSSGSAGGESNTGPSAPISSDVVTVDLVSVRPSMEPIVIVKRKINAKR